MSENGRRKVTLSEAIRKELRVVGSRNRSPLPLRIAKCALFLAITRRLCGTRLCLYAKIAELLSDKPGVRPEDLMINLIEVSRANWSYGYGEAQYVSS